jgi:alpha,alpha-trehalase
VDRIQINRPVCIALLAAVIGCTGNGGSSGGSAGQRGRDAAYDPAHDLGPLWQDVQLSGVFEDSKTFADARPRSEPSELARKYAEAKGRPGFNLRAFVDSNFVMPQVVAKDVLFDSTQTMEEHVRGLWTLLTRTADTADARSTLIPLTSAYIVPGGRFREVYYWDSYFTMLGLVESGRVDVVRSMLDNFAHLVRTVGHIPNGNRTYYLGRSQPPYFAAMVGLYARAADTTQALRYLDALEAEHAFWMNGADSLKPAQVFRRVVRLPGGEILNRYWDDIPEPRPEAFKPDYELAQTLPDSARPALYRNLRAAAESGMDFSTRWMQDSSDLRTIETTELIPVDLNSLLYNLERTIAALRRYRNQSGDSAVSAAFTDRATRRRSALRAISYEPLEGFFYDVRWRSGQRVNRPSLAAAAALYFDVASPDEGRHTADKLGREFLKAGGFVTTKVVSGQQWDAPNGWPPLEWLTIEGVRKYGRPGLADTARTRWLALVRRTYRSTGRMMEKYDVVDPTRRAGGGEYATQDGFGWTNGVALALIAQERRRDSSRAARR